MKTLNDEIKEYIKELGEQSVFREVDTKYLVLVWPDLGPFSIKDEDGKDTNIIFVCPEEDFQRAVVEPDGAG